MSDLLLVALAGFLAAAVDGALGMGFGPTSSSLLLATGMSPLATSATVNLAKVVSGAAGAVAHWRLGNVDRSLVRRLVIPGAAGAVIGALVLSNVDGAAIRPLLAIALSIIGLRILVRFSLPVESVPRHEARTRPVPRGVGVAGAAGGVTNGLVGAWGPVVTPFLLQRGVTPRVAVGSVNAAEVAVAVVTIGALSTDLGGAGLRPATVLAMLVGGTLAAPLAAGAVRRVPARVLGLAVGGLLLLTQLEELRRSGHLDTAAAVPVVVTTALVAVAAARPRLAQRGAHESGSSTRSRTWAGS